MNSVNLFDSIRPWWLERTHAALEELAGIIPHLEEYVLQISHALRRGLESGETQDLDRIIHEWSQNDLQSQFLIAKMNLVSTWTKILDVTVLVVKERLLPDEALQLLPILIPLLTKTILAAAKVEEKLRTWETENELLRLKQTLERNESSKSDFISVAAHELRTPLTLIEGYTSMLREAMPLEETKRLQVALCLKGIGTGTKRLRGIVDNMIDVSMIDNNMLSLNFQPIWLNRILESVEREFHDAIQERHLLLTIEPFQGSKEMLFGDGERLFQAFRNILENAIKYTPDFGSITMDGRLLPGFVEVIVSDTGIGIDPDQQDRIFEKFGRLGEVALHSSGKTKFKGGGPGLGLPITKGIIEAHGGAIWVESEGHDEAKCPGSKFHIMLPLRKSAPGRQVTQLVHR